MVTMMVLLWMAEHGLKDSYGELFAVLRGGSWVDYPWFCRSASRNLRLYPSATSSTAMYRFSGYYQLGVWTSRVKGTHS